jgi:hypothetical protein
VSKPEKTAGRFRPLKSPLILMALALFAFLVVSPPASSLDAAGTAPQAPGVSVGENAPAVAPGGAEEEPAVPDSEAEQSDAASVPTSDLPAADEPASDAPALEVPAGEAPAGPTADKPTVDKGAVAPAGAEVATARVPVPAAEKEKASTALRSYVGKAASTLATAKTPAADELAALAVGPAQGAILADAAEFENNGWHQEGTPTVEELEVVGFDASASPQRMTVNACIDSSKVKVVTAEGQTIRQGTSNSRSLNVLSLVKAGSGGWLVEKVSFPDDPTC